MAYTVQESGAFVDTFELQPTGTGKLNGLSFAAKDLIDISGHRTGCGNPTWRETHPAAAVHAVCVEQLLCAGARCAGKTITDELAYSLIGENHFYGTPLNPGAPDRVPGGSSSGSASAVACGLVDFALGTDTGGSVRVPAHNCGIWGIRPTHGIISVAGVCPLSPSFDTVGILASSVEALTKAVSVLLSTELPQVCEPEKIYMIQEAFDIADPAIAKSAERNAEKCKAVLGCSIEKVSIREIDEVENISDLSNWYEVYRVLQRAEAQNSLGAWVESTKPECGSMIRESLALAKALDRRLVPRILEQRENLFQKMRNFLGKRELLCIPTASSIAPLKGTIHRRDEAANGYYHRTLSLTSIAGVARLPQISMPLLESNGAPAGVSLLASAFEDAFLLAVARKIGSLLVKEATRG